MKKNDPLHQSLNYVFQGGIATSAKDTLAVGPTLTAYALLFGAGNFAIGLLGAVPFIGNLIHLLVAWMIERGITVKKIAVISSFLSWPFYLFAALLAFFPDSKASVPLLIFFLSATYLIGCMSGGAFMPWMKELIPHRLMGRFFSHRYKWMMIAKIVCFIFAYLALKWIQEISPKNEIYVYATLLACASLTAAYSAWTFTKVENKFVPHRPQDPFYKKVILTFKNKPFRQLLYALSILNFSQAFVTPFVTVFLLKRLNMEMATIILLTLILQISYTVIIKKWGKIADRQGPDKILILSVPLFIVCLAILTILNIISISFVFLYATLIICHIFLGIATAGITLGINNVSLLYIPNETASIYLSVNSVVKSAAGALGSIVAGLTLTACILFEKTLNINIDWLNGWTTFYTITALLCIFAIVLLKRVRPA